MDAEDGRGAMVGAAVGGDDANTSMIAPSATAAPEASHVKQTHTGPTLSILFRSSRCDEQWHERVKKLRVPVAPADVPAVTAYVARHAFYRYRPDEGADEQAALARRAAPQQAPTPVQRLLTAARTEDLHTLRTLLAPTDGTIAIDVSDSSVGMTPLYAAASVGPSGRKV